MHIHVQIINRQGSHEVSLATNNQPRSIEIPPKPAGQGSSVNGGELLFLALATCYCNDIYREAGLLGIPVERVEVSVEGEFGGPGEPARRISYSAKVTARADERAIRELMQHTDRVAEIHNTLRLSVPVTLAQAEVESIQD